MNFFTGFEGSEYRAQPARDDQGQEIQIEFGRNGVEIVASFEPEGGRVGYSVTVLARRNAGVKWQTPAGLIEFVYLSRAVGTTSGRINHRVGISVDNRIIDVTPLNQNGKSYGNQNH